MKVILSVDDNPNIIRGRRILLQRAGYDVLDASDGEEAIHILESTWVDLVLLDFYMPGRDGAAIARDMKCRRPHVPVIMVSSSAECGDPAHPWVDSFVFKGDGPESLLAEIARLLGSEDRMKEKSETLSPS